MPNRLAGEKSPYLLQHKDNPVDWRPWGEEAFYEAARSDRPVLLSIGYSTCHWCHVMEQESFSDPDIARLMNKRFVCVKLDREERPDVDKIYMTAVQAMIGQGGWPLNVFLTPQKKPFFGGTYFPPGPRWGRPGWPQLLERLSDLWKTRREDIEADARRLTESVSRYVAGESEPRVAASHAVLRAAVDEFRAAYDSAWGGFSPAPKFPLPSIQRFLLRRGAAGGDRDIQSMAVESLRAMCRGGLFDQIGGGFHRYSTDAEWRLPHFEKMLYDNAQLLDNLADATLLAGDPELRRSLLRTVDYLRREMRGDHGGFYCAQDADSVSPEGFDGSLQVAHGHLQEGAYYVWTYREIERALGHDAAAFCRRYGIEPEGNVAADPHGEFEGQNVPYDRAPEEMDEEEAGRARERLLALRNRRPPPRRDDKCLASWNGLALTGLSRAFIATGDERILRLAEGAADFLRREMSDADGRSLWHRWSGGSCAVPGMADDYAYVVLGLLDLYEAGFDPLRLDWAARLAESTLEDFSAPGGGLYQTSSNAELALFARPLEDHDGVEPSASAVMAEASQRLHLLTGAPRFRDFADATLGRLAAKAAARPMSSPFYLSALDRALSSQASVLIAGADRPGGAELIAAARSGLYPQAVVAAFTEGSRKTLSRAIPLVATLPIEPRASAYVCSGGSCGLPISDPVRLKEALIPR